MEGTTPLPPSLDAVDAGRPEPPSRGAQTGTKFPGDVAVPPLSSSTRLPESSDAAAQRDGTSTLALGGCGHAREANTRLWTDVHLRFRLGATLSFSACSEGPEEDVQQAGDRPLLSSPLFASSRLFSPLAATHTCIHASTKSRRTYTHTHTHALSLSLLRPFHSPFLSLPLCDSLRPLPLRQGVALVSLVRATTSLGSPSPRGRDSDPCLSLDNPGVAGPARESFWAPLIGSALRAGQSQFAFSAPSPPRAGVQISSGTSQSNSN